MYLELQELPSFIHLLLCLHLHMQVQITHMKLMQCLEWLQFTQATQLQVFQPQFQPCLSPLELLAFSHMFHHQSQQKFIIIQLDLYHMIIITLIIMLTIQGQ